MPRVSLGLPVYNGENYLAEAIDCLLAQTFEDFELIICDNASTDRTEEICRAAAARDPRVRYHRNEINLGAAPNFNLAFDLSVGEYFKWVAHDDLIAPSYVEQCVAVLDGQPEVVACHCLMEIVDGSGRFLAAYDFEDGVFDHPDPVRRYVKAVSERHYCFTVFCLMRRSVLEQTNAIGSYIGSDRNLIAQVVLRGPLVQVPEVLFFSREHGERSIRAIERHERGEWFDTARPVSGHFYFSRLFMEHLRILFVHPLTPQQRLRGTLWITGWAGKRVPRLLREFLGRTPARQ